MRSGESPFPEWDIKPKLCVNDKIGLYYNMLKYFDNTR